MARIARVIHILKVLALLSWRDVRSLGSIAGQNFILFVGFVAMQPESAVFFLLLLLIVLIFPLSTDPMEKIPMERGLSWPVFEWEWKTIRFVSVLLSPIAWVGVLLLIRAGWQAGALVSGIGALLYFLKYLAKYTAVRVPNACSYRMPALPGAMGAIMRLQWRAMFRTLDPYLALTLMVVTVAYRMFGKPLDAAAPKIMALVVAQALSTEAQVLFGLDGRGAERYRLFPIRGWQILLAKDLAFLALLGLLVWPLDPLSGMFGGLAALAVGHHNSVLKAVPQMRWRFTAGILFPHGAIQTVALFSVGNVVRTEGLPLASVCAAGWLLSVIFYGWQWDRQAGSG